MSIVLILSNTERAALDSIISRGIDDAHVAADLPEYDEEEAAEIRADAKIAGDLLRRLAALDATLDPASEGTIPEDRVREFVDCLPPERDSIAVGPTQMRWTNQLLAADLRDVLNELVAWRKAAIHTATVSLAQAAKADRLSGELAAAEERIATAVTYLLPAARLADVQTAIAELSNRED